MIIKELMEIDTIVKLLVCIYSQELLVCVLVELLSASKRDVYFVPMES